MSQSRSSATSLVHWPCWEAEEATRVINVDAPALSEAVFLSVHDDRPIEKRTFNQFRAGKSGTAATAADLLDHFANLPAPEVMFIVLVGESGSGKSHLVRWVRTELERQALPENRIVYLEKTGMTLRRVIEKAIDGLDDPEINKIRDSLKHAKASLTAAEAPRLLTLQLAMQLQKEATASTGGRQVRLQDIANLLSDPVYANALQSQPKFSAFATALADGTGEDDDLFEFAEEWLPRTGAVLRETSRPAQQAAKRQLSVRSAREAVCIILNDHRDAAVRQLIGLGDTSLLVLFSDLRRILSRNGQRLLFFVEDLAVLSGIETEFADAITLPKTPDSELCEIRILAASTTDPFRRSAFMQTDTIQTRIAASGAVYEVGQRASEVSADDLNRFTGRYLNAVRVGSQALEDSHEESVNDSQDWIPNACETCAMQEECHETFGASEEGHGLYPFNPEALNRAQQLIGASFDPRQLLTGVRDVLGLHANDLANGQFPPELDPIFQKQPDPGIRYLDMTHVTRIEKQHPQRHSALVAFLEYWGGLSNGSYASLEPIAEIFGVPFDVLDVSDEIAPGVTTGGGKPPSSTDHKPEDSGHEYEELLNKWSRQKTTTLTSDVAGLLRELVFYHVADQISALPYLTLTESWVSGKKGALFNLQSIDIHRTAGGGGSPGKYVITLEPSNSEDVEFLLALLRFEHYGAWVFPDANRLQRLYEKRIRAYAGIVEDFCTQGEPDPVVDAVLALYLGTLTLGIPDLESDRATDVVHALLERKSTPRNDSFGKAQDAALDGVKGWSRERFRIELLNRVGVRQGSTGDWRGVDFTRIQSALPPRDELVRSLGGGLPTEANGSYKNILSQISYVMSADPTKSRRIRLGMIERANVDLSDISTLKTATTTLLDEVGNAGMLSSVTAVNRHEWEQIAEACTEDDIARWRHAQKDSDRYEEAPEVDRIAILATDPMPSIERVGDLAGAVRKAWDHVEGLITAAESPMPSPGSESFAADELSLLEQLIRRLEELDVE